MALSSLSITEFLGVGHLFDYADNFIAAEYVSAGLLREFPLSKGDLSELGLHTTACLQAYELRLWLSTVLDRDNFLPVCR